MNSEDALGSILVPGIISRIFRLPKLVPLSMEKHASSPYVFWKKRSVSSRLSSIRIRSFLSILLCPRYFSASTTALSIDNVVSCAFIFAFLHILSHHLIVRDQVFHRIRTSTLPFFQASFYSLICFLLCGRRFISIFQTSHSLWENYNQKGTYIIREELALVLPCFIP